MPAAAPGGGEGAAGVEDVGGDRVGAGYRGGGRGAGGRGGAEDLDGIDVGLLAGVVRGAGGGRAERAAGELLAGGEYAGPAEDGQDRCAVDRAADGDGAAGALVRAAAGDPGAAGLYPGPGAPDPGPHEVLAAAGEAAGRRAVQAVVGGVEDGRQPVRAGHAEGDDRRAAGPAGPGGPGDGADAGQAGGGGEGVHRGVVRAPTAGRAA